MRRTALLLAWVTFGVLLASGVALAAAGDLDPSFGEGGKVTISGGPDVVNAAARQPDGKIIAAGWEGEQLIPSRSGADFALARLLRDGTLDSSFGGDGRVITNIGAGRGGDRPGDDFSYLHDVLVQPDGKIVAAGGARSNDRGRGTADNADIALARYRANGTLDRSFGGGDGKVFTDPAGIDDSWAYAVLRQPNGKLVVAGSADGRFVLVRYLADGRRDRSFGGGDGIVTTSLGKNSGARDLALQPNGKLVLLGSSFKRNSAGQRDYDFALARYKANGTLDRSFGRGDGKVLTDFGTRDDHGRALVLLPSGKLVVAGNALVAGNARNGRHALARLGPSGALDRTFGGGDGKVLSDLRSTASALVVQPDGKLVVAGSADVVRPGGALSSDFALVRYHSGGRLDRTFGDGDGTVLTDFGNPDYDAEQAEALVRQGDGKLVAVGDAYHDDDQSIFSRAVAARYLAE